MINRTYSNNQSKPKRTKQRTNQSEANKSTMFSFPKAHDKIYGDCDIYYYSMRILTDYLSGKSKIDLDKFEDIYNLGDNITDRIIVNERELPDDTIVFKLIKSLSEEHYEEYMESYCVDTEIPYEPYLPNLDDIDLRQFLMYACSEIIGNYKHEMMEGWTDNKWERQ